MIACKMQFSGYKTEKAIRISEKHWRRCADLAIDWNCGAVARRSIFNNANYDRWQVTDNHCCLRQWQLIAQ